MKESNLPFWQIEHQCPQCGAPVILAETDHILTCAFCRVRLYLSYPGRARYLLTPAALPLEDIIFVPYWRFKGMVFSCRDVEIEQKIVDSSRLAYRSDFFPMSLGVRPQVLRLKFATPIPEATFIKPDVPFEGFPETAIDASRPAKPANAPTVFHQAFVGETVSLIYSPLYLEGGFVYDAVLDKGICPGPQDFLSGVTPDQDYSLPIAFTPTLCPDCGWDMEGEPDTLVLLCRNCGSAWESCDDAFRRVTWEVVPSRGESTLLVPFWRIRARIGGIQLDSFSDLARLANLPRITRGAEAEDVLRFWTPAFKIQPQFFLRIARIFTLNPKRGTTDRGLPKTPVHPVTLPVGEAVESLKTLLASLAVPKRTFFSMLSTIDVGLEEYSLVFLSFLLRGNELVQPETQVAINRNSLNWGRLI